jgi:hypothetical protein
VEALNLMSKKTNITALHPPYGIRLQRTTLQVHPWRK